MGPSCCHIVGQYLLSLSIHKQNTQGQYTVLKQHSQPEPVTSCNKNIEFEAGRENVKQVKNRTQTEEYQNKNRGTQERRKEGQQNMDRRIIEPRQEEQRLIESRNNRTQKGGTLVNGQNEQQNICTYVHKKIGETQEGQRNNRTKIGGTKEFGRGTIAHRQEEKINMDRRKIEHRQEEQRIMDRRNNKKSSDIY